MQVTAYLPHKIFTGDGWLTEHAVIVKEGRIDSIIPFADVPGSVTINKYPNGFLAPSFIDVQIYGAYEKLFAVYPQPRSLALTYEYCKGGGATLFLPTVATNSLEVFYQCIDAVKEYWQQGGKGVYGLHLEGPWINKTKRGAHIPEFIHSPSIEEVESLLAYGKGIVKMITLAPEVCSNEVIKRIQDEGIIISAGHSNATYTEATKAFDNGITTATHLYNAMSPLQHREPGMVGALLNHATAKCSVIPDGFHADFAAVEIAKKIMKERLFAITDAVTVTAEGAYQHQLEGDKYVCNGVLSGSALTMYKAFYNLVHKVNISVEEALRMCSLYPAQVLGCHTLYGKIAPGYTAQFIVLNNNLELETVITEL
jgi:N-acetylglucosamine-6-phosphate deacetylase